MINLLKPLVALARLALGLGFAIVFAVVRRIRNAGLVDIPWSGGFTLTSALAAAFGSGDPQRRAAIESLTAQWGLRLPTRCPEAQALRSQGDAYRACQRRTSPFLRWFPKG